MDGSSAARCLRSSATVWSMSCHRAVGRGCALILTGSVSRLGDARRWRLEIGSGKQDDADTFYFEFLTRNGSVPHYGLWRVRRVVLGGIPAVSRMPGHGSRQT